MWQYFRDGENRLPLGVPACYRTRECTIATYFVYIVSCFGGAGCREEVRCLIWVRTGCYRLALDFLRPALAYTYNNKQARDPKCKIDSYHIAEWRKFNQHWLPKET